MTAAKGVGVPCQAALNELERTSRNLRRFWNLIYAVGAATSIALVYAIFLVAAGQTASGLVSGIGTLVGGSGTAFLTKLKNDAFSELREAKKAVSVDCAARAGGRATEPVTPDEGDERLIAVLRLV